MIRAEEKVYVEKKKRKKKRVFCGDRRDTRRRTRTRLSSLRYLRPVRHRVQLNISNIVAGKSIIFNQTETTC